MDVGDECNVWMDGWKEGSCDILVVVVVGVYVWGEE